MGWLIYTHIPACIRDEIARLCGGEDDTRRSHPVLISRKGTVWYAAVRMQPKDGRQPSGLDETGEYETDASGGYTFAAVFLTTREGGGWGYKSMDETMGPNAADAPLKLIDLLSPTTSEWARAWRQRCRDNAALAFRSLEPGDVIRLDQPLRFTDGSEGQTFRVSVERLPGRKRSTTVFTCTETGAACRIGSIRQSTWTRI